MGARVSFPDFQKCSKVRRAALVGSGRVSFPQMLAGYPLDLALMWRDTSNAKPLRYITFSGKYLVVKNV